MATLPAPHRLILATRESALAMWQAEHIRARLRALYPACEVALLGLTTQGDTIIDRPLAEVGGKGLFIKELEVAMIEGRADLAVHSLKDVPMDVAEAFTLAASPSARTRAMRLYRIAISISTSFRAVRASARRASGARRNCASAIHAADRIAARQCEHAIAQARRRSL